MSEFYSGAIRENAPTRIKNWPKVKSFVREAPDWHNFIRGSFGPNTPQSAAASGSWVAALAASTDAFLSGHWSGHSCPVDCGQEEKGDHG
jgi:hypothetical protein